MVSQSIRATSSRAGRSALNRKANNRENIGSAAISGEHARQGSAGGDHETRGHGVNRQGVVAIGEGGGHTSEGKREAAESESEE